MHYDFLFLIIIFHNMCVRVCVCKLLEYSHAQIL